MSVSHINAWKAIGTSNSHKLISVYFLSVLFPCNLHFRIVITQKRKDKI